MRDNLIFLLLNSVPMGLRGRLYLWVCRRQMAKWHGTTTNWPKESTMHAHRSDAHPLDLSKRQTYQPPIVTAEHSCCYHVSAAKAVPADRERELSAAVWDLVDEAEARTGAKYPCHRDHEHESWCLPSNP